MNDAEPHRVSLIILVFRGIGALLDYALFRPPVCIIEKWIGSIIQIFVFDAHSQFWKFILTVGTRLFRLITLTGISSLGLFVVLFPMRIMENCF